MKTRLAVVRGFRCTLSPSALSKRCSRRMRLAKSKRSRAVVPLVHAASGMAPPCARCERARLASPDRTRTPARCRRYNAPCAAQWPGSIPAASTNFSLSNIGSVCMVRAARPRPKRAASLARWCGRAPRLGPRLFKLWSGRAIRGGSGRGAEGLPGLSARDAGDERRHSNSRMGFGEAQDPRDRPAAV